MTPVPLGLTRPKPWLLPAVILLVLFSFVAAVLLGVVDIPAADVASVLAGSGSPEARSIILDIRLPRIVTGILAGIQFAVAGLFAPSDYRILARSVTDGGVAGRDFDGPQRSCCSPSTSLIAGSNTVAELPIAWLRLAGMVGASRRRIIYIMAFRLDLSPLGSRSADAIGAVLHADCHRPDRGLGLGPHRIILDGSPEAYARHGITRSSCCRLPIGRPGRPSL